MPSDSSVIADPASGIAVVAGTRVAMSAAADGALRFGGPGGCVLRPLAFGERTELVSAASALPAPRDAVAAAILAAATLERGAGPTPLMEVLAMWLAGAAFDAPGFLETTLLVARAAGWPPHELFAAPAREVDRLAVQLEEQRRAGEWNSLVFAEAPAETIEEVRARFADRLLRRSVAAAVDESQEESTHSQQVVQRAQLRLSERTRVDAAPVQQSPLSSRAAGISEPERRTLERHPTPTAPPMTTSFRSVGETPVAEAGPAPVPASPATDASTSAAHARLPLVGGIRLVVPREGGGHPPYGVARAESITAAGQRQAPAVSIRQPGAAAQAAVWSAAAELPFLKAAAEPPHSKHETFEHTQTTAPHPDDVAGTLAALLDDEADLRGVER